MRLTISYVSVIAEVLNGDRRSISRVMHYMRIKSYDLNAGVWELIYEVTRSKLTDSLLASRLNMLLQFLREGFRFLSDR